MLLEIITKLLKFTTLEMTSTTTSLPTLCSTLAVLLTIALRVSILPRRESVESAVSF